MRNYLCISDRDYKKPKLHRQKPFKEDEAQFLFYINESCCGCKFQRFNKHSEKKKHISCYRCFSWGTSAKKSSLRKVKNILFSAHRAGALKSAFFNMGDIVLKDMSLIRKNLKPKFCKKANKRTVNLIASKPVAINWLFYNFVTYVNFQ